ncbi:ribonuclease III [Helicobacter marmotae]|uniref:Ribonuclease 3 n=1 Tax=Helicobacter marmotae TaxID=152490 RepID=A0A3D8I9B6_9HELI|nr:ribonuclease III [Helicobacter marmotae]RDU61131.1 ribonuclease III [Helicobacter marmotae]
MNNNKLPKDQRLLEDILGYRFKDPALLTQALTHKSCKEQANNERLEFLGDAVLDLLVGEYLYKNLPQAKEGDLSKIRACIVHEEGFVKLAKSIDLGDFLHLSQNEENNNGRQKDSILSNAFEALIGAIYLETQLTHASTIINTMLKAHYGDGAQFSYVFTDYKTALQEFVQSVYKTVPRYHLISTQGPDHDKRFEVSVTILDEEFARAIGTPKRKAEQKAAHIAYEKLQNELGYTKDK